MSNLDVFLLSWYVLVNILNKDINLSSSMHVWGKQDCVCSADRLYCRRNKELCFNRALRCRRRSSGGEYWGDVLRKYSTLCDIELQSVSVDLAAISSV